MLRHLMLLVLDTKLGDGFSIHTLKDSCERWAPHKTYLYISKHYPLFTFFQQSESTPIPFGEITLNTNSPSWQSNSFNLLQSYNSALEQLR